MSKNVSVSIVTPINLPNLDGYQFTPYLASIKKSCLQKLIVGGMLSVCVCENTLVVYQKQKMASWNQQIWGHLTVFIVTHTNGN
jgi:hypothetical protein